MLKKLRSRHGIDLPYQGFGSRKLFLAVIAGMALLFIAVPLVLSPIAEIVGDNGTKRLVAIVVPFVIFAFIMVTVSITGKVGAER